MSDASGDGSANDATAKAERERELRQQLHDAQGLPEEAWRRARGEVDRIQAELTELNELTPEEQERQARVAELSRQLHEVNRQIVGTREHAAHVAMLRRLADEAENALDSAQRALDKAREHVEGKELAVGDAQAAYVKAKDALDEAEQGAELVTEQATGDGNVIL